MKKLLLAIIAMAAIASTGRAEEVKKVWEFGGGLNIQSLNRVGVKNFTAVAGEYNALSLDNRSAIFGLNIYVARELNSHFYVDFQSNFDFASDPGQEKSKTRTTISPSLGVQWRLGSYMRNKVIDPFVRVGVGYQYRNFNTEGIYNVTDETQVAEEDSRSVSPIAFGVGTNLWLTNRWGVGLQADYMLNPQSGIANQWQGSLRVVYRLGGKPIVCY